MAHHSFSTKRCRVGVQEPSPTAVGLTTTRIEVFIDEPDELVERALQAGVTDVEPVSVHDTPWGPHRQGGFTDPFGHRWSVGDRTHCNGFPGRRRSEPASGGRAAVVIIASAGLGSDGERLSAGVWTPSDIAWVPSQQEADPPHAGAR